MCLARVHFCLRKLFLRVNRFFSSIVFYLSNVFSRNFLFTCQSFFRVIVFYVSIVFFASIVFCLPVKVLAMRSLTILFRHVDKFLRRVSLSFSVLNFRICVKFSYNILKPQKMFLANLKNFYVCNFFSKQFRTEGSQDYIMAAKMIFLNMV